MEAEKREKFGITSGEENLFEENYQNWRKATAHLSSLKFIMKHPSFLAILERGEKAIPLILDKLNSENSHLPVALHLLTGELPEVKEDTREALREAWLKWGEEKGYLSTR